MKRNFNFKIPNFKKVYTVEPVLSGTVLSGHPLLSGHVAQSRKFHNTNTT